MTEVRLGNVDIMWTMRSIIARNAMAARILRLEHHLVKLNLLVGLILLLMVADIWVQGLSVYLVIMGLAISLTAQDFNVVAYQEKYAMPLVNVNQKALQLVPISV